MAVPESAEPSRFFAQFAAFIALVLGSFVLAGWWFDMAALTNLIPGWPSISRLTAIGFFIAGLALWLATLPMVRAAATASLLLTAIGVLVLLRYSLSWDAYIDQLLLSPMPALAHGGLPPRMAPATAVAFCCF